MRGLYSLLTRLPQALGSIPRATKVGGVLGGQQTPSNRFGRVQKIQCTGQSSLLDPSTVGSSWWSGLVVAAETGWHLAQAGLELSLLYSQE